MNNPEISQMNCRGSMWRGFAERIETMGEHTKGELRVMGYEGGWTGLGIRDEKLGDQPLFKLALNNEDNATRAMICWNSHDQLLEACQEALKVEKLYFKILKRNGLVSSLSNDEYKLISDWHSEAEAAIALSEKE